MSADDALDAWRNHNHYLLLSSLISIAAAIALCFAARGPDGFDACYLAVAIEFAVWGAINCIFAVGGVRGVNAIRMLDLPARANRAMEKAHDLIRVLKINHWLNGLWLGCGVALLTWGYAAWSPSLVGHGVGVFSQAIALTLLDFRFIHALRAAVAK